MLPDSTTTIGDDEFVKTDRPFHNMNAVERTRAKLRTWAANCRGWRLAIEENMFGVGGSVGDPRVERCRVNLYKVVACSLTSHAVRCQMFSSA
jgi:hypothetical protein